LFQSFGEVAGKDSFIYEKTLNSLLKMKKFAMIKREVSRSVVARERQIPVDDHIPLTTGTGNN